MKLNDSWIEASYAPSNRATCKGCHLKISMKDLRLSTCSDAMEMVYQNHFHYDCFILQKKFKDIELKDIFHIQSLEKVDQEKVQKKIEQLKLGFGKQKIKVKSSQKETKKAQESDEELDEAKMEQKMSAMLLEGKSKQIKQQSVPSIKKIKAGEEAFNQSPNISSSESEGEDDKIAKLNCYTAAEKEQYIKFRNQCQEKTISKLKEMLKNNDQKCTGTKPELIQRIADCKVLGVIPRCPKCGGGRLQFLQSASKYKCPGFMDDTVFKRCNKTFKLNEVTRTQWMD